MSEIVGLGGGHHARVGRRRRAAHQGPPRVNPVKGGLYPEYSCIFAFSSTLVDGGLGVVDPRSVTRNQKAEPTQGDKEGLDAGVSSEIFKGDFFANDTAKSAV